MLCEQEAHGKSKFCPLTVCALQRMSLGCWRSINQHPLKSTLTGRQRAA